MRPSQRLTRKRFWLTRRTGHPARSRARNIIASTEALVGAYTDVFGGSMVLTPELILMMLPPSEPKKAKDVPKDFSEYLATVPIPARRNLIKNVQHDLFHYAARSNRDD
jgi:hypothetical protein